MLTLLGFLTGLAVGVLGKEALVAVAKLVGEKFLK